MRHVLLLTLVLVTLSLHAQQRQPESPPVARPGKGAGIEPGAPGGLRNGQTLDLSDWYPHVTQPPFISVHVDSTEVIHLGNARFSIGSEPELPRQLTRAVEEGDAFQPGYWIVHFAKGVDEDAKQLLNDHTSEVQGPDGRELARWYIPNRSLIAYLDSWDTHQEIAGSDLVDWMGPYHPAYKLSPNIGGVPLTSPERVARDPYMLNVDLIPGHDFKLVTTQIENLGLRVVTRVYLPGKKTYDVHYLVVAAPAARIVDLAQLEGVRFIQETGDGKVEYGVSGGGKLQNRSLTQDDQSASPIITAADFPLWLTHNLQGQGQLIGVVDSSLDWNNVGTSGCNFGFPDSNIDNWGFALPNLSSVLLGSVGSGGVNLKIPRSDLLGGATLQGSGPNEHGCGVAGAALGDFYGNDDTKWWEHDPDNWEPWAPANFSGLLGPGIAHEAQLYFTPVDNSNGAFRWEFFGEFPTNMGITLNNMAAAGVCTTNHSVGLAETSNSYSQTSVVHDTAGFDNPSMLQCMAAGNSGATSNAMTSQSVVKNNLAVGASDDVLQPENRVTFSSIGPAFDGRLKPDIMAPGNDEAPRDSNVQSQLILPDSNSTSSAACEYQFTAGTSFASPTMAGAGALVHQYFEEGRYGGNTQILDPSAALMKAMLINAGHRLTGANLGNGQYPNNYQGWGEPKLTDVLDLPGSSRDLIAYDVSSGNGFNGPSSPVDSYEIAVNSAAERLRVTLVWTDEPGSTGQGKKLINDLHLIVTSPGGSLYRGNVINGSSGESTTGGGADTDNNVENVILSSPQLGTWTVTVDPSDGNYSVGQGYALVVTGVVSENVAPAAPSAEFVGSPTSGNTPLTVGFTNQSTGSITSYSWNFGDGGTSSATNPSHTYTSAGTFTVSLTTTGPGGSDTRTRVGYITASTPPPPPVAEFVGTPTSGDSPLNVAFTDQSTGSISTYSWNFGDGGSSSAASPSHTYTAAGTYTVAMTVTGPGGSDTRTRVNYITVTTPPPVADFSGTPTSGNAPLTVNFTDQSTGSVSTHSWNFGDGGTSSAANPGHTYTSTGTFTVSLTVTGPGGSDSFTRTAYISVSTPPPPPVADFSGTPTSGTAPLTVAFTDQSAGSVSTYSWNFGDGGTSSAANPGHTYTSAGTYSVSLTVTGPGGSDSFTRTNYIVVAVAPPVAEFVGSPTSGTVPLTVNFTNQSTGSISSHGWDFGDGGTSSSTNPSHTYTVAGTYTVVLTTSGPGGSDTRTRVNYITVNDPPAGGDTHYYSFTSNTSVPGVGTVADDDVVCYDVNSNTWTLYFDGSDVGLGGTDINALDVRVDGSILMSFNSSSYSVPGVGTVDDSDVVLFLPTTTGPSTSGTFLLYMDGSDVGLSSNGEDIDGIQELSDGTVLLSTLGSFSVPGASGRDEDAFLFIPTSLGSATAGSFLFVFDGSDMGLSGSSEDINALSYDETDGALYFSTVGNYSGGGGAGADEDISRFLGNFGTATSGSLSLVFDLSALGISTGEDVDGFRLHH